MIIAFRVAAPSLYKPLKPLRDPKYKRWLKTQPCAVCGRIWRIDPCHTGPHGFGEKSSDYSCIALCRMHHNEMDKGPVAFAEKHGIDIGELRERLNMVWGSKQERRAA